ncbi:MAG TPA: metallophosphoesterase [Candidatus Binatia bacterium]|nr:metallophosphoesterase [Candidatus Binatia bacterium]
MDRVRVAAMGDVHCTKTSDGELRPIFDAVSRAADVLLLCGDLTDYGLPEEAEVLAAELRAALRIPALAVLGNHDYESGVPGELKEILARVGLCVLDGEAREIHGVGFAGVKGFAGGFGDRMLGPWGEQAIKVFVREAVDEALKLEVALGHLGTSQRIVLLHYAPIEQTVAGEPPVVVPFLGSSRLEEPINRFAVAAVFHGHAHHGAPEGRTSTNVPVYNVCMPLLRERWPDRPPFRVIEVPRACAEASP